MGKRRSKMPPLDVMNEIDRLCDDLMKEKSRDNHIPAYNTPVQTGVDVMPSGEYEEFKKKTVTVVQRRNYSIRFIEQTYGSENEGVFYQEIAQLLFERALKKSE
ncbi:hypothetical protein AXI59_16955 [Bacillus nakamurai]|uniref:hypothetical protein n=2 Tax=Bacillus nakamurai TaxID=1793963 RepID=UPI00077822CF|nr:hypothetical protein [Bacillus nakamurai]KXZ18118.1 hypothetical protein AXI59_16955 [Bacillus nakamurai]